MPRGQLSRFAPVLVPGEETTPGFDII